jgi:hypothetical protein
MLERRKMVIGFIFITFFFLHALLSNHKSEQKEINIEGLLLDNFGIENTRDFNKYDCLDFKRFGGMPEFKKKVHDLFRMEGAWFACLDGKLGMKLNDCNILSFGINVDESFDEDLNSFYKCKIESFDPFTESDRFQAIRARNADLKNAVSMVVKDKWSYHKIGLVGNQNEVKNAGKPGWMATLDDILVHTNLKNEVIDLFKMDIENSEWSVLENMDMDYACKYFKQIAFETHIPTIRVNILKVLRRLEKCFLLFRRDPKFYKKFSSEPYGFLMTEWQLDGFLLDIKEFKNEIILSNFLLTIGELYFVNQNYL